jgi:hypothetical protein
MLLFHPQSDVPAVSFREGTTPKSSLVGVIVILIVLSIRILTSFEPTPGWGGDPLQMEAPILGLTPIGSLIVDACTLAASILVLLGMARRGRTPRLWQTLCLAMGAAAIALHARVLQDANMENLTLGSCWLAAFVGAFAIVQAANDPRLRALIVSTLLGLIAPLAVKGAVEYFVEHPQTVQEYLARKDQILAANGWTADSPMARAYWERLRQAEATGWFGLANVLATLAAASFTALAGFAVAVWRAREIPARTQTLLFLVIGIVLSAASVVLAGSKGGYGTAAIGLTLVLLPLTEGKSGGARSFTARAMAARQRLARPLPLLLPLLALLIITLRGLVGERLHELSLLFRWFYIQTASKIFAAHPLLGTGPDGFKDAYMLLKPAISPEDVSSPHSIFFDLAARLGLGGLALVGLLIAWLWGSGRNLVPKKDTPAQGAGQKAATDARLLLIIIAAATAAAALLEQPTATLTSTLVRAAGMGGFMLVAAAAHRVVRIEAAATLAIPAVAAAAVAAMTHCQIELTGVTPGANLWVLLLLAVASATGGTAPGLRAVPKSRARSPLQVFAAPAFLLALLAFQVAFGLIPAARWDLLLRSAYAEVEDISWYTQRAEAIAKGKPNERDSATKLAADLTTALHHQVDPPAVLRAVDALRSIRVDQAASMMEKAAEVKPRDSETVHALVRLELEQAATQQRRGNSAESRSIAHRAEELADTYCSQAPGPAQFAWLGLLRRSLYELDRNPEHLVAAVKAYEQAAGFGPHEPLYAAQLARCNLALGRREEAAKWAATSLAINEDLHLAPLRQFSDQERSELTAISEGRVTPPALPHPPGAP